MELLEAASIMPEDVAGHLPKLLLAFAAGDCLQETKEKILMFKEKNGPDTKVARSEVREVVRILRDCRTLGLEVNQSWSHFLLELLDWATEQHSL